MRWGELLIGGGMGLLAVAFYALASFRQDINPADPGPAFYPKLVSLLLLAFSIVVVVQALRDRRGAEGRQFLSGPGARYTVGTLGLSALYLTSFDKASYLATTPAFLIAVMVLAGVRRWPVLASVAVVYTLATYYLFGWLLMVPMP